MPNQDREKMMNWRIGVLANELERKEPSLLTRRWIFAAAIAFAVAASATPVTILGSSHETEVRIAAQRLSDGRTEFALQQRDAQGNWGERILPSRRFFPAEPALERWLTSTPLTVRVPGAGEETTGTAVRIAAQRLSDGRTEFALQQRDAEGDWGERILPSRRFFPAEPALERWLTSTPLTVTATTAVPSQSRTTTDQRPTAIDGAGRKLLAIYMVGSDLEDDTKYPGYDLLAGTKDLEELIAGYNSLTDKREVEVLVAFGGANKDGWRGMKFANMSQIIADSQNSAFGDETGAGAYLRRYDSADMDDENSLKLFLDYIREGYTNFDLRFLTMWDHGASYRGFGGDTSDGDPGNDTLSMDEIERAFVNSAVGKFDLIGFDACSMASVEVAKVIAPNADYMIASEDLEPGHGWLWSAVIQFYAQEDSVVDSGKLMVENFVQDVHGKPEQPGKTLSLLNLGQYDQLAAALDPMISVYGDEIRFNDEYSDSLIHGVTGVRKYGEPDRSDDTWLSMDMKHFAQLLMEESPDADTSAKLEALIDAIDRFVVHSRHDGTRPNSFGIAIDVPGEER